ncbi:MAG: hypothetical protein MJE68_28555 [Proteobacteria bacterium]|nr:hypothetical protein [Pseudomonadota bacterium]
MKTSAEIAEKIRSLTTTDGATTMVSFDVVSLFTRVPLDDALEHLSNLLASDNTLDE